MIQVFFTWRLLLQKSKRFAQYGHNMEYFNSESEKENQVKRFIFLRHGITDWNWRMIPDGPKDWSVSEAGKRRIRSITESLYKKGIKPSRIITSPLKRCIATATIIHEKFSSPKLPAILVLDQLQEIYYGDWSLERQKEAREIIREAVLKVAASEITEEEAREDVFMKIGKLENPLDAEPWESFIERVQGIDKILAEQPDSTFLVGHGVAIEEYLKLKGFLQVAKNWQRKGDHRPYIVVKTRIIKRSNADSEVVIDDIENAEELN